jgi:cytochrome d ubiquinol oxidase subunit I
MPSFNLDIEPIHFPLLGNSLVVGIFSLLHIALAGLSVGFMVLAPVFEVTGRSIPYNYDLARAVTRFTVIVFSVSTVLAVIMVELMIGLFPVTTMWAWNRFHAPIGLAIAAFILQLAALYPYYHFWDALRQRQPVFHTMLGALAALFMLIWVAVLDGMGSSMLTPVESGASWGYLLNPTWLPLMLHRLVGDILMAGYVIAAYGAWRSGRPEDREQHGYYAHLFSIGWKIGVAGLLSQPITGLLYALSIQNSAPAAYDQLIHGPYQFFLYIQFGLIGLLFVGTHLLLRAARPAFQSTWVDIAIPLSAIVMVLSVGHPNIRRLFLYVLAGLLLWALWPYRHADPLPFAPRSRLFRSVAIGVGVVSILTYLTMGTIRETVRRPDTIRGVISLQDEVRHPAADRAEIR